MKDFLLHKKWIGAMVLIGWCLISSMSISNAVVSYYQNIVPLVEDEISAFLPLEITDGMIERPANTLIEKSYGDNSNPANSFKLVLDTRTEIFEPTLLNGSGVYVSRSALYLANMSKNEVKVYSFRDFPDLFLDQDSVSQYLQILNESLFPILFSVLLFLFLVAAMVVVSLTGLVINWLINAVHTTPYRLTLRINTYVYVLWKLILSVIWVSYALWWYIVIAAVINFAYAQYRKQKAETENA